MRARPNWRRVAGEMFCVASVELRYGVQDERGADGDPGGLVGGERVLRLRVARGDIGPQRVELRDALARCELRGIAEERAVEDIEALRECAIAILTGELERVDRALVDRCLAAVEVVLGGTRAQRFAEPAARREHERVGQGLA